MGNNAKQEPKKPAEEKKFIKPVISWTILALELLLVIVIGCVVCRF